MNTLEAIGSVTKVQYFNGQLPTDAQMEKILQAAQAAPLDLKGYEETKITVITDSGMLFGINYNAQMNLNRENDQFNYASMYILVSVKLRGTVADGIAYANAATVVQNMVLAAVEQGVGACPLPGPAIAIGNNPELLSILDLGEGQMPVTGLALGQFDGSYQQSEYTDRLSVRYI